MNKQELIDTLAEKLNVKKSEATNTLNTVLGTIIENAVKGECVVPGLGKLKLVKVKATSGVAKGVKWSKPEHNKIKLSLSKEGQSLGN